MQPLRSVPRARAARIAALAVPIALSVALLAGTTAYANVTVTQVSHDIYTDAQAQHNTEVEPDTFVSGSTIVSAFQVGRVFGGGASNIGWATSTDGGTTWTHGYLPGITANGGGSFGQASDASVAYDARHNVWLITSLGVNGSTVDVLTSRSTDGGLTWGTVTAGSQISSCYPLPSGLSRRNTIPPPPAGGGTVPARRPGQTAGAGAPRYLPGQPGRGRPAKLLTAIDLRCTPDRPGIDPGYVWHLPRADLRRHHRRPVPRSHGASGSA